jgi:cytidylate kinase
MSIPSIIAIDGPAASGKSTLGQHLACELGYLYFDTGVMYRALTWVGLQRGIAMEDEESLTRLAQDLEIDVRPPSVADGRAYDILADGVDVTWDIRRQEVEANVSVVSAYAGVRAALSAQQRRIGLRGRVVMVGRDIGTVVLPQADLKIFLDASAEERARRRYQELLSRGQDASYDAILQAMLRRDRIDSTRDVAPLRAAPDAVILNTDHLDAGQVLEAARRLVFKEQDGGGA